MTNRNSCISLFFLISLLFSPFHSVFSQQPEQDCINAIVVCSPIINQSNSYTGEGILPNEINPIISCLGSGEENNVWYKVTIAESGLLSFLLTPNFFADDYDFAVYNLTNASCSDIATDVNLEVSCNYSATSGPTGANLPGGASRNGALEPNRNSPIPVLAGETYLINVSNFSGTSSGYVLDFSLSDSSIGYFSTPILDSLYRIDNTDTLILSFSESVACGSVSLSDFEVFADSVLQTIDSLWSPICLDTTRSTSQFKLLLSSPLRNTSRITLSLVDSVNTSCGNVGTIGSIENIIPPAFQTIASPQTICEGDSATLSTNLPDSGFTYLWLPDSIASASITVSPPNDQIYRLVITDTANNINQTDTVHVQVIPNPVVDLGADLRLCNDSLLLSVPLSTWASFQWENASSDTHRWITDPGTYALHVVGQNGCMAGDSIEVIEDSLPHSNFVWTTDTLSVSFTDSSTNADSVFWDFGDGSFSNTPNPSHTYDSVGTFTVGLITSNECGSDTLTQEVVVTGWATSISQEMLAQYISIYPNPGTSYIDVKFLHTLFLGEQIQLFDLQGRLLTDYGKIMDRELRIRRDKRPKGIYFLRIGIFTRKIWFE